MSYSYSLKYRNSLRKEFMRFWIKLLFCFILIVFLMYTNFYWALGFLIVLLVATSLASKFFKKSNSRIVQFIFQAEHEYEEGFPGKEAMTSLLGFITVFVTLWALYQILIVFTNINFPVHIALILGLVAIGVSNNLATLILFKNKVHYVIYGTTMEFLVLASVIGAIIFMFLGMPVYFAIFLAFGANLLSLIPWDHNFTIFLTTSLLFTLLLI